MTKSIKDMSRVELEKYCSDLEQKKETLERDNKRLEVRLLDIMRDWNWMKGLFENRTMPVREKMTLYGLHRALGKKEPGPNGLTHIYKGDIAKVTGLTDGPIGDSLGVLEKKGLIERDLTPPQYNKETGKHERHNFVALGDAVKDNPKAIDFGGGKAGGRREKGKPNPCGCGCTERVVDRRVTCAGCGSILEETRKTVKADDDLELDPDEEVF